MTNISLKIGDTVVLTDWYGNTAEFFVKADWSTVLKFKGGSLDGHEVKHAGAYSALKHARDLCYTKIEKHLTV